MNKCTLRLFLVSFLFFGHIAICQIKNVVYFEKVKGNIKNINTEIIQNNIKKDSSNWVQRNNDTIIYQFGSKVFSNGTLKELHIKFPSDFGSKDYEINYQSDSIVIKSMNNISKENKISLIQDDEILLDRNGGFKLLLFESGLRKLDSLDHIVAILNSKKRVTVKVDNELYKYCFDKKNNIKSIKKIVDGKTVTKEKIKIYEKDKNGNWTKKYHQVNDQILYEYIRYITYL